MSPDVDVELADTLPHRHRRGVELNDGVCGVGHADFPDVGCLGVLVDGRVDLAEASRELGLQAPRTGEVANGPDAVPHLRVGLSVVDLGSGEQGRVLVGQPRELAHLPDEGHEAVLVQLAVAQQVPLLHHLLRLPVLWLHGAELELALVPALPGEAAPTAIRAVGHRGEGGEQQERDDGLPQLHLAGRHHLEHHQQPDVGQEAEQGCHHEHLDARHALRLAGHAAHADGGDDEQVEGRRAHDGAGPQRPRVETVADDLHDGEQDLGRRGAERHEGEVGHRVVPDAHLNHLGLVLAQPRHHAAHRAVAAVRLGPLLGHEHLARLAGDALDGRHEDVGDDGHTQEQVEQGEEVKRAAHLDSPSGLVQEGQQQATGTLVAGRRRRRRRRRRSRRRRERRVCGRHART